MKLKSLISHIKRRVGVAVVVGAAVAIIAPVSNAAELLGLMKKAETTGSVTIGYRESSMPFSYLPAGYKAPIGYSIDICKELIRAIKDELELKNDITIKYVPVTSENRIEMVASGQVDLECGSTTANQERKRKINFSPTIFVAGTKLMVARTSKIQSYHDLAGKTVVVTAGTTNETAMRTIAAKGRPSFTIITGKDHAESYELVNSGKADAFATDDALLLGLIARNKARDKFVVVGDLITYDPYGIGYRNGDPQMDALMLKTFQTMAGDDTLDTIYRTWFRRKLPTGETLALPMSAQLENMFTILGGKDSR